MTPRNFFRSPQLHIASLAILSAALLAGCGAKADTPELGSVSGTVTLDGEPLPEASVRFQPTASGRPASATTDANGYYELQYTADAQGAVLGEHVVRISTGREGYDDGEEVQEAIPEKVPAKYNRDALDTPEMHVEIKPGANKFDFKLKSEGEIVQPMTGEEGPQAVEGG